LAAGGRAQTGPVADFTQPAAVWFVSEDRSLYALTESGGLASRTSLNGLVGRWLAVDPFGRALVCVDRTSLVAVSRAGIVVYRTSIEAVSGAASDFAPAFGSDGRAFVLSGQGVRCFNPAGRLLWELLLPAAVSCPPATDGSGFPVFGLVDGSVLFVSPYGEVLGRFPVGSAPSLLAPMAASRTKGKSAALGASSTGASPTALPSLVAGFGDGSLVFLGSDGQKLGNTKLNATPRELRFDGNFLYCIDAGGRVYALTVSGIVAWSTPTACAEGGLSVFKERIVASAKGRAVSMSTAGEIFRELSIPDATGRIAVTPGGYAFSSGSNWVLAAYRFERPLGEGLSPSLAPYTSPPDIVAEELLYDAYAADADRQREKLAEIRERLRSGNLGKDEPRMAAYCAAVASGELLRDLSPAERKRMANPLPRAEAAYILGELGSPDYRPILIDVLRRDTDPAVQSAACEALAAIGVDPGGSTAAAFFDAAARPVDERTALVIVEVIAGTAFRFGSEPSLDTVRALLALADKPYLPAVRAKAAAALSRLADTMR
jgi:outer membrane protein assembly factor BamB